MLLESQMAQTQAEIQKAYRRRLKAKQRDELKKEEGANIYHSPFSEWVEHDGNFTDFDFSLALIGIHAPWFKDERGPEEFVLNDATEGVENPFSGAQGAIGRAEITIGCLIDAAATMAGIVNRYKQQEIKTRLTELESSETADRATAMSEAVKLNKMLDQLDKQVRWSFPQWKVTGV
jgi:hypothetical protein